MSNEQRDLPKLLREAERRVNARVFKTGGDDSLASIPANLDRDVDLLLMEAANVIERLRAACAELPSSKHGERVTFEGCDYVLVAPEALEAIEEATA